MRNSSAIKQNMLMVLNDPMAICRGASSSDFVTRAPGKPATCARCDVPPTTELHWLIVNLGATMRRSLLARGARASAWPRQSFKVIKQQPAT